MAKSCATATTRGGMSFEVLCTSEDCYYVCDPECLVHVTQEDTLQTAEDKLVEKINKLFLDIQIQKDATIKKFYVGKTYVPKNKRAKQLDPLRPTTWAKSGISSRWCDHRQNDYGKDGMIVIAVVTRNQIPTREDEDTGKLKPVIDQELFTLALEQRLLHHYKITEGDLRIDNETFASGKSDEKRSAGYALYVVFSLEKHNDHDGENMTEQEVNGDNSDHDEENMMEQKSTGFPTPFDEANSPIPPTGEDFTSTLPTLPQDATIGDSGYLPIDTIASILHGSSPGCSRYLPDASVLPGSLSADSGYLPPGETITTNIQPGSPPGGSGYLPVAIVLPADSGHLPPGETNVQPGSPPKELPTCIASIVPGSLSADSGHLPPRETFTPTGGTHSGYTVEGTTATLNDGLEETIGNTSLRPSQFDTPQKISKNEEDDVIFLGCSSTNKHSPNITPNNYAPSILITSNNSNRAKLSLSRRRKSGLRIATRQLYPDHSSLP